MKSEEVKRLKRMTKDQLIEEIEDLRGARDFFRERAQLTELWRRRCMMARDQQSRLSRQVRNLEEAMQLINPVQELVRRSKVFCQALEQALGGKFKICSGCGSFTETELDHSHTTLCDSCADQVKNIYEESDRRRFGAIADLRGDEGENRFTYTLAVKCDEAGGVFRHLVYKRLVDLDAVDRQPTQITE